MTNGLKPAVVLSSHTMGLGVIRALGSSGIPVVVCYYEKKDMGYVSKYVVDKILTPHPEEDEKAYLKLLVQCAERYPGSILIPADDPTLFSVARNKDILSKYFVPAFADESIIRRVIDKKFTYALAEEIGVPCPRTIVPASLDHLEEYSRTVEFPCLVKPCQSHKYFELFRKKMELVQNFDQMAEAYRKATDAGIEVMVQEFIPGDDSQGVNYNSYFWDGEPLVEFTAEKIRLSPPAFGVPRVVISKKLPEIIEPGRKILKALGYHGYSCTEFKRDARDGIYKFMEVNGRHNRSALLAVSCGVNFPLIEYRHLMEGHIPMQTAYDEGVYWIDEFRDIIDSAKYCRTEKYSLAQYLRPYYNRRIFAVADIHDLRPAIKRTGDIVKMGFQKIGFIK
jgi:predicted ATP-grasp superfamily ATP-dependent carboligase